MKWFKRIAIALVLLLAAVVALPFFITLNDYIPRIEKAASDRLKEPVSIKNIGFTLLPAPTVTIDGIAAGGLDGMAAGRLRVTPDLFSLWQPVKVIKLISIDGLNLSRQAAGKLAALAGAEAGSAPQIRIENIQLDSVSVSFGTMKPPPLDVHIAFDSGGGLALVSLVTRDGKFRAQIKPSPSGKSAYLIEAAAKAWTLPAGPALLFDELTVRGRATRNEASFDQVSARLMGGAATGKTYLSWRQGWQVNGSFKLNQIELYKAAGLLSPGTRVSGRLSAQPVFSASAASAAQLVSALRLKTFFNVQNGVLYGLDIQNAASVLPKRGASGGETRFDRLSGHLLLAQGRYNFTQLQIASGSLAADGQLSISPGKKLSGRINAKVSALGVSTGVPLTVSGTLDAPVLYPTGGTMAGAAVGTVLMGPGFGTSVGAKVGGWAEDLFDGKKVRKSGK